MATLIFPGRFQPFHNGHLMVVKGMTKLSDSVVIVICDGGKDADDMFGLEQRREMISAALLADDLLDATIVTVKDAETDEAWATHVLDVAGNPAEPVVWSGNEGVLKIFEAKGVATKKVVPVPGIVGADIRQMIKNGDRTWRSKVPAGAMDVIERASNG